MKQLLINIIFLLFSITGFTQIIGIDYFHKIHTDIMEIKCDNYTNIKLKYSAFNYKDSLRHEVYTIDLLVNSAQRILKNLNLNKNSSYELILEYPISCAGIVCDKKEKFQFEIKEINANSKTYLAIEYGDSLVQKPINIIRFQEDFVQITIAEFSQLDSIENIDFKSFFANFTEYVHQEKLYKYDISSIYSYHQGIFKKEKIIKIRKEKPYIAIRPSVGIGIGLIKGRLINNGSILIETSFNDVGLRAIRLYAQYEIFTNYIENKVHTSGFINLGANLNLSGDYEPKDWIGFGLGYLIHHQEMSIFNKNTLKIYFERQVKIGLKIRPEIYLDFNESELFLGFSISQNI